MNTVLDNNKTLCLMNREMIPLRDTTRIIFHIDNLSFVTPATVSRLGILYNGENTLGWKPLIEAWSNQ